MQRRSFLKGIGAALAAFGVVGEVDPEKLLWVPGARSFFLPSLTPPKPLVTGADAAKAYDDLPKFSDSAFRKVASTIGDREVSTAAGHVVTDEHWNVKSLNGRQVSAAEAARLRLTHFARFPKQVAFADLDKMTGQIIADRVAAGWADPIGPRNNEFVQRGSYYTGYWQPSSGVPRKIDIEGS
jgi:hypothetical protein